MSGLTRDAIKYLAIFAMTLDHIAYIFLEPLLPTTANLAVPILYQLFLSIGSFTGPVMIYFLIEGYGYTHDARAYAKRLLLFALVSQVPFTLAFGAQNGPLAGNMLFTLLLCFGVLYVQDHVADPAKRRRLYLLLFALSLFTDWNGLAVPFVFFLRPAFHREEQMPSKGTQASMSRANAGDPQESVEEKRMPAGMTKATVGAEHVRLTVDPEERRRGMTKCLFLFLALNLLSRGLFAGVREALGLCLGFYCIARWYNGKQATTYRRFHQYFFYIYYPGHLLILWALHALLR